MKNEIANLTKEIDTSGGAGGTVTRTTNVVPKFRLRIASRTANLPGIRLLLDQPNGDARYRDGVLAMDALLGGFTLDCRSMRLRVD